ncbi:glycosyltransferase [Megasphaera hominis]|jgi:rhamnosyltransferase|uniref:Glycosyltransferase n=1 Tax=Megasphaera hominis TaxID=159836 RepID=A0ABR6VKQ0_9FIRM|nr:glycosyltransferase [Megasphaera hominis]MBC3537869.1 glycosyltransferase [Megasphaera hominis]
MSLSIAGVVILYNPDESVYKNISSYAPYIQKLYIIDNSEHTNENLLSKIIPHSNIIYIPHKENKGISYSLNEALRMAEGQYDWLLTMDQDSRFADGKFPEYIQCLTKLGDDVYGICPASGSNDENKTILLEPVEKCITSGNIIRIKTAICCGGFDENLFIDEVDHEFCYRCNKAGYRLLKYKRNILIHALGHPLHKNILGFHFNTLNEGYIRQYYIFRNKLYVCHKYPERRYLEYKAMLKWFTKIILGEPDKLKKILYIYQGFRDYYRKKFGKYPDC